MLGICQYRVCIILKACPDLYILNWLSHNNHTKNKDQEIAGMSINKSVNSTSVNMPVCTSIKDIQATTWEDTQLHTHARAEGIHNTGLATQERCGHSIRQYWPIRSNLAMIDGIVMEDKNSVIPSNCRNNNNSTSTVLPSIYMDGKVRASTI